MWSLDIFSQHEPFFWLILLFFAFLAGYIDAVVGGGGLIQLPALLIAFPQIKLPHLFGTNKLAALFGTSSAAYLYAQRVKFNLKLLIFMVLIAALGSYLGANSLTWLNPKALKPLVLILLILMAIYTFIKKDIGQQNLQKQLAIGKKYSLCLGISLVIGFYDGFFGPGTGGFLVMALVYFLGFSFLQASAYAKIINAFTNLSALSVFLWQGQCLFPVALLMGVFNVSGAILGGKMALKYGNVFVRKVFLVLLILLIARYAYDVFSS